MEREVAPPCTYSKSGIAPTRTRPKSPSPCRSPGSPGGRYFADWEANPQHLQVVIGGAIYLL